jgi:L-fuculose-phosphate aldolase
MNLHPEEMIRIRKNVAAIMRRLYKRGLTTPSGGNVSYRFGECVCITPSALDKGRIKGKQVGMLTLEGENLTPMLKPSIEASMHLALYKCRPDIQAIVHAHPPLATSFTAMKSTINCTLIAESRAILGEPVTAPYALMGTEALASSVAKAALTRKPHLPHIILLENHGIVCLGKDLLSAFDRLEVLEAAARMTLIVKITGDARPLTLQQLEAIDRLTGI